MNQDQDHNLIRNFCIIAHINHGKSTLADRFLEITNTVEKRKMQEQYLDMMSLERERGITIKMQPVNMNFTAKDGQTYKLNLIDTPGHVDFSYEVSRALAAVEGAILLVDATKGVQAQTLANLDFARQQNLKIIPAVNKVDLENAQTEEVKEEISKMLQCSPEEIIEVSAKTGVGVAELLEKVIRTVPPPKKEEGAPFRALIFDSMYNSYGGVIAHVRIFGGRIKKGDKAILAAQKHIFEVEDVGGFKPERFSSQSLEDGSIGWVMTGFKEIEKVRVGDTIIMAGDKKAEPLHGYKEPKPVVFASFYPKNPQDFKIFKDSLLKLKLNDAALYFEEETSEALDRGFRCGFLGMLHLDIIRERLKREYNLDIIISSSSVIYKYLDKKKNEITIYSPAQLPDASHYETILEPYVKLEIVTPLTYFGSMMKMFGIYRIEYVRTEYFSSEKVILFCVAPMAEIIGDFYDTLKSISSGYASLSYEFLEFRKNDLVKMDILIAGEPVDAFSRIVMRDRSQEEGKKVTEKLKEILPRQMFSIAIQAAIGGKIIARETITAMRKDVTGYLYGGDVTRKMKLLNKQKRGKKKMRDLGKVDIPSSVFVEFFKK
jgi:GTP-binding protein LepA